MDEIKHIFSYISIKFLKTIKEAASNLLKNKSQPSTRNLILWELSVPVF